MRRSMGISWPGGIRYSVGMLYCRSHLIWYTCLINFLPEIIWTCIWWYASQCPPLLWPIHVCTCAGQSVQAAQVHCWIKGWICMFKSSCRPSIASHAAASLPFLLVWVSFVAYCCSNLSLASADNCASTVGHATTVSHWFFGMTFDLLGLEAW